MRTFVKCMVILAALFSPLLAAQPVVWNESFLPSIRMLPEAPDSRTPISFELVKSCDPLHLGRVERSGSEVRVELWGSDYCAFFDPPRTQTKQLGILPSGHYTVDFYFCAELPSPDTHQCFLEASQGFTVTDPIPRPIPFALPATLLVLPALLLLVASRMLRRR